MKRPQDNNLTQQRLPSFPAYVSTLHIAIVILAIGVIFLPVGTMLTKEAESMYEHRKVYDNGASSECHIESPNEGLPCEITISFDEDVNGPVFVYYELTNFYQNHRRYYMSRSNTQLMGENLKKSEVSLDCSPLYQNGTDVLNPCGLIANSFFNDVFVLNTDKSFTTGNGELSMNEKGIALYSDRESVFKQVQGFKHVELDAANMNNNCTQNGLPESCKYYTDSSTNISYQFYYPNDDTTQYLYEMYPNQISPIKGVTDEHFIVWMRTDLMPTFRKLYGKINHNFKKNDKLVFDITANYETHSFHATKSIVLTKLGDYGGRNEFPGVAFTTAGAFCLIFGSFLVVKDLFL